MIYNAVRDREIHRSYLLIDQSIVKLVYIFLNNSSFLQGAAFFFMVALYVDTINAQFSHIFSLAMGLVGAADYVGQGMAITVGSTMFAKAGYKAPFFLMSGLCVASLGIVVAYNPPLRTFCSRFVCKLWDF